MITIKDVLNLDAMKGASIVAGEDFIDNLIESINVMDAPDSMTWVRKNELVLTTGYPISTNPEDQIYLIEMLKEKGCAALGIKSNRFFDLEDSTMIDIANKYGLPIISVPYTTPFSQLISEVLLSMSKPINDGQIKKLLEEALYEEDLDRFICTVSKLIEENVSLESQFLENPICYCNGVGSETLLNSIHFEMNDNEYYFSDYYYAKNNRIITLNTKSTGKFVQRQIFPIRFKNKTLGLLSLWKENEQLLSDLQLNIIDYVISILTFILRESEKKKLLNDKINLSIGIELINYNPENRNFLNDKIKHSGLKLTSKFRVLTISGEGLNSYKEDTGDYNYSYFINKINTTVINNTSIKSLPFFYNEKIIIIIYDLTINNQNELKNIVMRIENILGESDISVNDVKDMSFVVGLSKEHEKMEDVSKAYKESLIAIEIGKDIKKIMNIYVDSGIVNHIFGKDGDKINNIIKESILPILNNNIDSVDLFNTLDVFFENNESITKTADQLFIHRNTLKYRLKQINQLTGLDINKINDKLTLYMGVVAYKLIKDDSGKNQ